MTYALTGESTAAKASAQVLDAVKRCHELGGNAVLIWSGGNTPRLLMPYLTTAPIDWSRVSFLVGDERWVPPTSPLSNEGEMRRYMCGTPLERAEIIGLFVPGCSSTQSISQLEDRITPLFARQPCVALLGMGEDGHTASLFPGGDWVGLPRIRRVVATTGPEQGVSERVSLTPMALLSASRIVLLCNSPAKRAIWDEVQRGVTPEVLPVAILTQTPPGKLFLIS